MQCPFCGGRVIQIEGGYKCRSPQCEGASQVIQAGVECACGQMMLYKGLNSWGEPEYVCDACGRLTKL